MCLCSLLKYRSDCLLFYHNIASGSLHVIKIHLFITVQLISDYPIDPGYFNVENVHIDNYHSSNKGLLNWIPRHGNVGKKQIMGKGNYNCEMQIT